MPSDSEVLSTLDPSRLDLEDPVQLELARRIAARGHLLPFTERWTPGYMTGAFHEILCHELMIALRTPNARLIIQAPPRHGKSQIVSRALPAYIMGAFPDRELIVTSYGQDLSDEFGRWVQRTTQDPRFQRLFPHTRLQKGSKAADRLETTEGGGCRFVGMGGAITGRGGSIIIDDPVKNREEAESQRTREAHWDYYSSVLRTRLPPGGSIVLTMTRWHEDDLAGRLLKASRDGTGEPFQLISFPAIAKENDPFRQPGEALHPERWSLDALLRIKQGLLPRDWAALYQQDPTPEEGAYFQRSWFKRYRDLPDHQTTTLFIDPAISKKQTADWTVMQGWAITPDRDLYLRRGWKRARMDGREIVDTALDLAFLYNVDAVCMEHGQIFLALEPLFREEMTRRGRWYRLESVPAIKDKPTRARAIQGMAQMGKVYLPDEQRTDDLLFPEIMSFPSGEHDDQVDTMSHCGLFVRKMFGGLGEGSMTEKSPPVPEGCREWWRLRETKRPPNQATSARKYPRIMER